MGPKRLNIARVIAGAREEKGLSQTELAERIGCHVSTVCGWESETDRQRGQGHIERTIRLLRELGLNPAKLV